MNIVIDLWDVQMFIFMLSTFKQCANTQGEQKTIAADHYF